ncbi:MAG: hypothetical protein ACOYN4_15300 [Bacteroidales bacterium]
MIVNYIYDKTGQIEYAVIPYNIWDSIKNYALSNEKDAVKQQKFEPSDFIGMLSHYDFDLEYELQQMKSQWKRDLL